MNARALTEHQMLAIMAAASTPEHQFLLPLLDAALDGRIELIIMPRGAPWPDPPRTALPQLLLIGDDDLTPSGPAGWPSQIRDWPKHAMIHAAVGSDVYYRLALANCLTSRRYAIIETDSVHLDEWFALFRSIHPPIHLDVVKPPPGDVHPRHVARSEMQ